MKKPEIILIGGGGHCRSCIDVIEQENIYKIAGILDMPEKVGETILGYEIIGSDNDLPKLITQFDNFHITVGQLGSPIIRMKLFELVKTLGGKFPVIVSPNAYVSQHSDIREGTIIMHGAIINVSVTIGCNCIINSQALIEHDALIGDYCHISTAGIINGGVKVGSGTFFGSGAVTKQYISIPEKSFIKANSIIKQ